MEAPVILGLSFNTRNLGLAVVKLNQLVDYSSKLHKQKWSSQKMEMILTSLVTCTQAYTIQKMVLSIPHIRHQTSEFRDMMRAIIAFAQMRNIDVITYSPQDLSLFIPDAKKKTSKVYMQQLVFLYPELAPCYEKEVANKNKYYYKMFEAIGVATLYSRKIGKWRS
jgi:RNase H-fold protein (predicted Holliday junction resolvase)